MIKKHGSKYVLYSHDGKKKLSEHKTKEEAEKREMQVKFFKHKEKKK